MRGKQWILVITAVMGGIFIFYANFSAGASDCATSTAWSNIKINEVSSYTTSDWVELYNIFDECVDLTGLELRDATTNNKLLTSIIVQPHQFTTTSFNNRLDNGGDSIILITTSGLLIFDQFNYSNTSFPSTTSTQTLSRRVDGQDTDSDADWALTDNPTPGTANTITAPQIDPKTANETAIPAPTDEIISTADPSSLWAQIRLNEIMPDPDVDDEWVEIYNPGAVAINLAGGYICDARGATTTYACKDLAGTIGAMGYLKFDLESTSYLNNTGDSVYLKNPAGATVDSATYSASANNQTYARAIDGTGIWKSTLTPTPDAANNISESEKNNPEDDSESNASSTTKTSSKSPINKDIVWTIKFPTKIVVGSSTVFSADGSLDTRGGRLQVAWDLGENTIATGTNISYSFVSSGPHLATVFATSTAGSVSFKNFKFRAYPTTTVSAHIAISAVMPNQTGDTDDEYIKIKNLSEVAVDVSLWQLMYKNQSYQFPRSTTIAGHDELIFYQPITKFTLNNSGGAIELRDHEDFLVDVFEYGQTKAGQEIASTENSTTAMKIANAPASPAKKPGAPYLGSISITDARAASDGAIVKVTGSVVVAPNIFGSQYFYLFDGESGIQIYQYKKDFPPLAIGDKISAEGTLGTASGVRRIRLKSKNNIDILATGQEIIISTSSIEEMAEEKLGGLVKISGEITEIKSNLMYIDDGNSEAVIYFKTNAKIDKKKFKEGENITITGVLEQAKTGYQIWPRGPDDIVSIGSSSTASSTAPVTSKQTNIFSNEYFAATAGGLTAFILAFIARALWLRRLA